MSGVGLGLAHTEDSAETSTSAIMESTMMEGEEYYNPDETETWTHKETVDQLCRICAKPNQYLIPIFEGEGIEHQLEPKIQKHLPIEVYETDELPLQVCYQCASTLIAWNDLVIACIEADKKLRQMHEEEEDEEDNKGAEFFDEPAVDSDVGDDEPAMPSTSTATVTSNSENTPLPSKKAVSQVKKPKLKMVLVKNPTAGPSGLKNPSKKSLSKSKDVASQDATERYREGLTKLLQQLNGESSSEALETCLESPTGGRNEDVNQTESSWLISSPGQVWVKCEENSFSFIKQEADNPEEENDAVPSEEIQNLSCMLCSAENMSIPELKKHLETHAEDDPLVDCETSADETIYPKFSMFKHITYRKKKNGSAAKVYSCAACGQYTIYLSEVIKHVNKECCVSSTAQSESLAGECNISLVPSKLTCDMCSKTFRDQKKYVNHLKIHSCRQQLLHMPFQNSAREIICSTCLRTYPGEEDFEKHLNTDDCKPTEECGVQQVEMLNDNLPAILSCNICHRTDIELREYEGHVRLHTQISGGNAIKRSAGNESNQLSSTKITCNICLRIYTDINDYERHMKIHQNNPKCSYVCVTCGKTYSKHSLLEAHMVCHAVEPANCSLCGKTFKNDMMLKTHMMLHTDAYPFQCPMCDNGYVVEASLRMHIQKEHNTKDGTFQCSTCGKIFSSKLRLKLHQDVHGKKTNQRTNHLCSTCGKCFKWKSNLNSHEKLVHKKDLKAQICSVCGKLFKSATALVYHMANHEGIEKFICDVCGLGFCSPRNLRIHKFCHSDLRPFVCKICEATFKHRRNLQHHRKSVHGVTLKEGAPRETYPCEVCNKTFSSLEFQMDHMRTHNNEQPFECKICGDSFSHYQGLFQHKRTGHTLVPSADLEEGVVSCSQCDRCFDTKKELQEHEEKTHGRVGKTTVTPQSRQMKEPISCKECGRVFSSSRSFVEHSRRDHGNTGEYLFSCKRADCNKCYKNLVGLRQHEYKNHSGLEKKMYTCPICNKVFTTKNGRDYHVNIHTGEMSFTCETCGKSFRLKSSLVEHSLTHTNLMPVTCGVCNKHFRKRAHLITHMRTHTGEKPYTCDICQRGFAQAGDRNKHRLNIHRDIPLGTALNTSFIFHIQEDGN